MTCADCSTPFFTIRRSSDLQQTQSIDLARQTIVYNLAVDYRDGLY